MSAKCTCASRAQLTAFPKECRSCAPVLPLVVSPSVRKGCVVRRHGSVIMSGMILIGLLFAACLCRVFERPLPLGPPSGRTGLMAPLPFQEADLFGTWQTVAQIDYVDTLMLTEDRRFQYTYMLKSGPPHHQQGTWFIERRASGCVYLHLKGMSYFHGSAAFAQNGNRVAPGGELYDFWEQCEQQWQAMPDKVILSVTDRPNLPRGIGLLFPATKNPPDSSVELMLIGGIPGDPQSPPTSSPPEKP